MSIWSERKSHLRLCVQRMGCVGCIPCLQRIQCMTRICRTCEMLRKNAIFNSRVVSNNLQPSRKAYTALESSRCLKAATQCALQVLAASCVKDETQAPFGHEKTSVFLSSEPKYSVIFKSVLCPTVASRAIPIAIALYVEYHLWRSLHHCHYDVVPIDSSY